MSDKGYSTGGAKKWLIIIGGIVFVAVVIVIILMAIPPNTYNAVQTLYRTADSSFLASASERNEFEVYGSKIASVPELNYYYDEIADTRTMALAVNTVLDFYSNQLVFAENNKNLKKNYKLIKNNLNEANKHKENLSKLVKSIDEYEESALTYLQNTVIKIRGEFIAWLKANAGAFDGLGNGCAGSLGKTVENNAAFKIITSTVTDALNVVIVDFDKLAESDKWANPAQDYEYTASPKVDYFNFIVNSYIASPDDITDYYFDKSISENYELISQFYSLYGEKNFVSIISTLNEVSKTDFTFEKSYENVADEKNVLNAVKVFLNGGKGNEN